MSTSSYRAAVFDLDGTLLDSLNELGIAANTILEKNGFPTHPLERYKLFVGEGAEILMRRALGEKASDDAIVSRCLSEFLTEYHNLCGRYASLYPGIPELLDTLCKRGLKLAVLSNKPHHLTLKNIDLFLKEVPFELVLGHRDGIPKKPDPHGAFEILDHLKIKPEECLYLGDTAIDMKTAAAAGLYPVGVLWGFRDKEELLANGARTLINHPLDLMRLL
jgi:phosphoglycolate phosphatase